MRALRGYAKVSPRKWTGALGDAMRGDAYMIAMSDYLMTGPQANMIGLYRWSLGQAEDDTGFTRDEIRTALERLSNASGTRFLRVDDASRTVFVVEVARHEWGDNPNPAANQVKTLVNALPQMLGEIHRSPLIEEFGQRYTGWAKVFEAAIAGCAESDIPDAWRTALKRVRNASGTRPERVDDESGTDPVPESREQRAESREKEDAPDGTDPPQDDGTDENPVRLPISDGWRPYLGLTFDEQRLLAELLPHPAEIDTATEATDGDGQRTELVHRLAWLAHVPANGHRRGPLELWAAWRRHSCRRGAEDCSGTVEAVEKLRTVRRFDGEPERVLGMISGKPSQAQRRVGFTEFWDAWPRKVAKKKALAAWEKTFAERPPTTEILAAVALHSASNPQWQEDRFIPHPATWLNGGQWEDELPAARAAGEAPTNYVVVPPDPEAERQHLLEIMPHLGWDAVKERQPREPRFDDDELDTAFLAAYDDAEAEMARRQKERTT